jgi:hypothetical protein
MCVCVSVCNIQKNIDWVFHDTRLFVVVAGFLQFYNLQPRPRRSSLLRAWPACAWDFVSWTYAWESQLVFQVSAGGDRWFSAVICCRGVPEEGACYTVIHAPTLVKAISRCRFCLAFLFVFFCLYFYSQFDFVMLKCYWTFCWHSSYINHLFLCLGVCFNVKGGSNSVHIMLVCCLNSCFKSESFFDFVFREFFF